MNILVTGGGTVAAIDDVRAITNRSSGRFSSELTESFLKRGDRVWHVHAPGAQRPCWRQAAFDLDTTAPELEFTRLEKLRQGWQSQRERLTLLQLPSGSVKEYAQTVRDVVTRQHIDIIVLAMAVSDYEPVPSAGKLPSDGDELVLRCHRVPKVIDLVRAWAPNALLVGFKLLSDVSAAHLIEVARAHAVQHGCDLVVANDWKLVHTPRHVVHLVWPSGRHETLGPSSALAEALVERVGAARD